MAPMVITSIRISGIPVAETMIVNAAEIGPVMSLRLLCRRIILMLVIYPSCNFMFGCYFCENEKVFQQPQPFPYHTNIINIVKFVKPLI